MGNFANLGAQMVDSEKISVAAVLITKNEEANLRDCLASVRSWVDEIVILDSGSTDRTQQIAEEFGARFFQHAEWPGFGRQRQMAQEYVASAWCLWIDADERVTPPLRDEILAAIRKGPSRRVFAMPRLNWFFGRFIRHCGWYPKPVVRLYPTTLTRYNDAALHEEVQIEDGIDVCTFSGDLLHYPYADLRQYVMKSSLYANEWAQLNASRGKNTSLISAILRSILRFMRMYVVQKGFFDGWQGFLLCVLSSYYTFLKYAGLWVLRNKCDK